MIIIIGNVGSTSLKSKIIDLDMQNEVKVLGEANLDRIKTRDKSNFQHRIADQEPVGELIDIEGYESGIKFILKWYIENGVISSSKEIQAIGFKCVLGETNGANLLTPEILEEMERYLFVAPVHNKPYLDTIKAFKKIIDIPMVGVFEPSFHYSVPEYRKILGLPWKWHKMGIKKHGFHGSTHRYLSAKAYKIMKSENIKLLTVHLGGSSSICALKDGKSVDIDQSFSSNSGLLQGTRVGDTDGTAILFAIKELNISIDKAGEEISNNAGLKGIAGIGTEDLRKIISAAGNDNPRAKLAIDAYVYGIRKHIGALSAVLGGLDCLVFGGGIGERNFLIRERILEKLDFMGIKLDPVANKEFNGKFGLISSDYSIESRVKVYIVPTNEEMVVAYFTKKVLEEGRDLVPEEMVFRL